MALFERLHEVSAHKVQKYDNVYEAHKYMHIYMFTWAQQEVL